MHKKLFIIAVSLLFAVATMILPAHAAPSLILNGQALQCDNPPVVKDSVVLVPVRTISEALGAKVHWDGPTKTVTVALGNVKVNMVIDGDIMVNGQKLDIGAQAKIYNDATMLPLAAAGNLLGAGVAWDSETQTVTITTAGMTEPDDVVEDEAVSETETTADDTIDNEEAAGAVTGEDEAVVDDEVTEAGNDEVAVDEEATVTEDEEAAISEEATETSEDEVTIDEETTQSSNDAATVDEDAAETGTALTPFQLYLEDLKARFVPEKAEGVSITYQFVINEGNKGNYFVTIKDGQLATGEGTAENPTVTITVGEQLWLDIASGKEDGTLAYFTKKFTVDGDPTLIKKMSEFFQ